MTRDEEILRERGMEGGAKEARVIHMRILGTGCAQCEVLYELVAQVARELNLKFDIKRIGDMHAVLGYDILARPALIIDGALEVAGHLPSLEQLRAILTRTHHSKEHLAHEYRT